MAKVTGIGGVFQRSVDPAALAEWYKTHLGMAAGHDQIWAQEAGPTVFAPFKADSDYFPAHQQVMLNLRVDDLAGFITSLTAGGVAVETKPEWDGEYGKFARIHDPAGHAIELWQPPAD
jgi:glyoxylase I family protein